MASAFPGQASAVQVESFFLGQYYPFLQRTPKLVHQFYTNASTMIRYDGDTNEKASGMAEIHNLIVQLNFTEIEILTAHSLESWDGGVLVTVTGFVQVKDFIFRRKFVETFFLAPQEKGYFVLNDIFLFLEEEQVHQNPAAMLTPADYDTKLDALNCDTELDILNPLQDPEDIRTRDFLSPPIPVDENNHLDNYSVPGQPNQTPVPDKIIDEAPVELTGGSVSTIQNIVQDPVITEEEPAGEGPKHTCASILRTANAQVAPQLTSVNKIAPVLSEWHHAQQATKQQVQATISSLHEKSSADLSDEAFDFKDEVSCYTLGEDIPARDVIPLPITADDHNLLDNCSVPGQPNKTPDPKETTDEAPVKLTDGSVSTVQNIVQGPFVFEEPVGERPKHAYESILQTAKAQVAPLLTFVNKIAPVLSEWHHAQQATRQQARASISSLSEKSSIDLSDETFAFEDEGESKSVYVGNLPANIYASDLERRFRNFGRIKPDGVTIRSRMVLYGFIEFEDAVGVQNALKASPVQLNGMMIYVERKRPYGGASRGGRRSRGRGGYYSEASRGRFDGRSFAGRGGGLDNDSDYNGQPRGNGYIRRPSRQERGDGYIRRPPLQERGDGYIRRPPRQERGDGYIRHPPRQESGDGYYDNRSNWY